jgi:hypothetical protein
MQNDTGDNDIEYTCIILPTIIVRDFWLSPAVHIVCEMRSKGVVDEKLLELILLGAYQTSWFRFWYVGLKILKKKRFRLEPFQSYVYLAEETFGTITGGPIPRADPPGIDVKAIYYPKQFQTKKIVIHHLLELLKWVNECPENSYNPVSVRDKVIETSKAISSFKTGAELGEFCLMLILQLCALSSVVLRSSPKLQNMLYPIPGKGSANHLIGVKVDPAHHQDALHRVLHNFDLNGLGTNAGESILCETIPGRNVYDVFFPGQNLFLLNTDGKPMRKKYASMTWKTMEEA